MDFFNNLDKYTSVYVYSESTNETKQASLQNLMINNNLTGADLMTNSFNYYENQIWYSDYNKTPLGDLSYQYLNNNYLTDQQALNAIFENFETVQIITLFNL